MTTDGYIFSSLGTLIGINAEPETIVDEILEAYEYLKCCKEFDDKSDGKKQRLMIAVLLAADSYGTGASMIRNAFINNALSVIKTQQIAAMINVIANAAAAVLGAIADKNSTESGSDKAEQPTDDDQTQG